MSSILTIDAQTLGHSFSGDPELKLPHMPRFISEVLVIPFGESGLLFEGVRDLQVISGRSARTFIPQLLPLLDGQHSIDMLQARFPRLPPGAVRDAVVLLYTRGLLEDGAPGDVPAELADLAAFAGRYNDVTRISPSRREVLARLAKARVAVVDNEAGRLVAEGLDGHGLAKLERLASPQQLRAGEFDLLVAMFDGAAPAACDWFAAAHACGLRALHAHVGRDHVEIGPYIIPGISGCYDCLRQLQPAPQGEAAADLGFWAGVAALQASNLISRLGSGKLYNSCRVHLRGAHEPVYEKRNLARLPGCRTCGLEGAGPPADHPDARAWVLHNAAHVMVCKELRSPRDHQIHYAATNLQLTRKPPRPRHGAPLLALPGREALALLPLWSAPTVAPQARASAALLGQMLRHAAGYQDSESGPRRIAASGGGLASCELYVIVRKVDGIAPGAYHYFGHDHQLERIGVVEDAPLAGALGIAETELPPLLVIGTSDMRKTRQKYDDFSFRIGVLDGGVARQYLQDIADAAGVAVVEYADVRDPVLAYLLQLATAGNRSMMTFAIGIGDVRIAGEPPDPMQHHYQGPDALIAMCARLGPTRPALARPAVPTVAPHALRTLGELMAARRSHRRFAPRPVPARVLHALAALACDAGQRRACASGLDVSMRFWMLVVRGSAELAAGVYGWDPQRQALTLVREGLSREEVLSTMQQLGYAEAAVTCFVSADFQAAVCAHGPRGYRELVSRAGSMMARAQLGAMSWDVVGSMWGGVAEEGVGRLLGIDRYRDCPIFAASFGYPADD